ncbi:hypothetical protein B0H14DRAFT_2688810 [Mycena olivaceomarginata]|nr:hypothetical protein B0H14DRAFT_2688810 [Mycena olivaceomarginata]
MLESLLEPLPLTPSPVNRLLRSNEVPLDSEALVIRSIVSDGEDRMHALDAHIVHLQATLAQLSQRRDETVEHLRVHRANPFPHPPRAYGVVVRDICVGQHYALSYPLLWSSVTVGCYPCWYESDRQRLLSKLQTQLSRATNASLDIHWSGVTCNGPDSRLLGLILPHSNRWRNVSFYVNSDNCRLDWLLPTSGKLDRLETLEVENFGATTFPDVFTTAPNLRRVVLTVLKNLNRGAPIYLESIPIPWGQITHYRGEFPWARQLEFLQAAPNLSNCALEITEDYNFIPPTDTTVVLPHLQPEELCSVFSMWMVPLITPFIRQPPAHFTRLVLWQCRLPYLLLENSDHQEEDGGTDSDVCPHIVSMIYGYDLWDNHATQDAFISMAKSRFRTQHDSRSQLSRSFIQMLQDEGLDVAFLGEQETTDYLSRRYI